MARKNPRLTYEELARDFLYDPSGYLIRRATGRPAKGKDRNGYSRIQTKRGPMMVHHLVWMWHHKVYPTHWLTHINGDRSDNRIKNLQERHNGKELTLELLRSMLSYDPETGVFVWKVMAGGFAKLGDRAGYVDQSEGYRTIGLCGEDFKEHRLAWFYVHGSWPELEIDHANGVRSDNRISNLRLADDSQSAWNAKRNSKNTSGYRGVCYWPGNGKYKATIAVRRVIHHLGYFDTAEDAAKAYQQAAIRLHGEFANFTR